MESLIYSGPTLQPELKSYSCPSHPYHVFVDHPGDLTQVQTLISSSLKEYYKRAYFEFADTLNGELNKRFCQKNFELYIKAKQLLITAATTGEVMMENMKEVCSHFGEDLEGQRLKNQLSVLSDVVQGTSPSLESHLGGYT